MKKFKYSYLGKVLCVILALVTGLSGVFLTTATVCTIINNVENSSDYSNYTDAQVVRTGLSNSLVTSVDMAHLDAKGFEAYLKSQKQSVCKKAYDEISDNIKQLSAEYLDGDGSPYRSKKEREEFLNSSIFDYYDIFYQKSIDEGKFRRTLTGIGGFTYDSQHHSSNITFKNYKSNLKKDIEKTYDKFVIDAIKSYKSTSNNMCENGVIYRVEKNGKVIDSNTSLSAAEIMKKCDSFKIEKGKAAAGKDGGISQDTLDYLMGQSGFNKKDYSLYAYINTAKNDSNASNKYELIRGFYNVAQTVNNSLSKYIALDVIVLAASFLMAFYYFKLTGKKDDESPAKLNYLDYIPLLIQLGIVGGAGFGLWVLFFGIIDMPDLQTLPLLSAVFIGLCLVFWALLFELCCSISRWGKSDKKFYKHLFVYWIGFVIWHIFKLIIKLFKKWHRFNKSLLARAGVLKYKPKTFVRNVILLSLAFFAGNIGLMMIIVFFFAIDNPVFGFIFIVADMVANVLALRKVCLYFKSLDEIIYASKQHIDVPMALDTLPQSLQILAESMKYTNAELQNAIAKAVKDERLRAELITNVSHDLKTPLTSIITYVDLLKNCDIADPKAQEYIHVLDDKGAKLKRLIDDLIEASKVTSGNVSVNLAPMNLSELCLQSTVDVQQDFEKNNLNLVVKQGEKPVIVTADGAKTFRVVENLLSNARKYSARGSRVYVSVYEQDDKGIFEIKNISAQPLDITPEELTERFVRGDKSRTAEGNGLGLSIAKELCKLQNGELELSIDGDLFKAKVEFPLA